MVYIFELGPWNGFIDLDSFLETLAQLYCIGVCRFYWLVSVTVCALR